jgi:hypothetical protein
MTSLVITGQLLGGLTPEIRPKIYYKTSVVEQEKNELTHEGDYL